MEGLVNVQKDLQKAIEKGLVNFKKSPKVRLTEEYIETRLEMLEKDWSSFRANNSQLYGSYKLDNIEISEYVTLEIYEKTEDVYIEYKSQMKIVLKKFAKANKNSESNKEFDGSFSSLVKLPKISIPMFSGRYNEWTTFRDLFVSLIHKNTSLDNVQKLHYLKGHLTGEAEQLIRQTPITDANYNQCWLLLESRYDNKKYLANCIFKRLFSQRRSNVESASSLKELSDTTSDCLNALSNLGINVSTWDSIIIHMTAYKLDPITRKQWELQVVEDTENDLPTWAQFKTFLQSRFRALECLEPKRSGISTAFHNPKVLLGTTNSSISCEYCSEQHKLCFCKNFAKQSCDARREFVRKNNICFNCLGGNHMVYECKKQTVCRVCKKRHHSLLHQSGESESSFKDTKHVENTGTAAGTSHIVSCLSTGQTANYRQILLATALINAKSRNGEIQVARALIDQGSQACFVTEATVQLLRLRKTPIEGSISGLGQNKTINTKSTVTLSIESRVNPHFNVQFQAYVLSNITCYLPERNFENITWTDLQNIPLADPQYNMPNKIDILLGADVYCKIMMEGIKRSPFGSLIAQNTALGWILSGEVQPCKRIERQTPTINVMHAQVHSDELLRRFWEIEENLPVTAKILTVEEQKCETFFVNTTTRTKDGRYVVKLPFRNDEPPCNDGKSRDIAIARLKSLEKRFTKDQELKEKYTEVIEEYLKLGHMRPVKEDDNKMNESVYLPHHAVIRNDRTTTKVRVVFNASQKDKNGISLNSALMVGPTLQADLRDIVLKWRLHSIGLVADIVKMYRQIRVAEEDVKYQRIVWRNKPEDNIKDYELLTVTFGTASAPYLAVRALHQVAYDEEETFPLAAAKVLKCFYMDDLMTGCDKVEDGVELYNQIAQLLKRGGFELQKFSSNSEELLEKINGIQNGKMETVVENKTEDNLDNIKLVDKNKEIEIKTESTTKILGLTWNREKDTFQYSVKIPPISTGPVTKRMIIADIARLFDPLGWLAPSVVLAKIFIQKLWLTGLEWDETLNEDLVKEWNFYRKDLKELTNIRIPRWIRTSPTDVTTELHGFSDASKAAYAAVVYLRVVDASGQIHTTLLISKTRVAPIKQISIPRLELCGAVLLSKILTRTAEVLGVLKDNIRAWTDSTVVLAWLNSHPSRWKTFVGNRVSEILTSLNPAQWFHVSTKLNPADRASRGVLPTSLIEDSLWFSGPPFLKDTKIVYTQSQTVQTNLEESIKTHFAAVQQNSLIERFSSLQRLVRVVSFCRRFFKRTNDSTLSLKKEELEKSLNCCIKVTQRNGFEEYQLLEKNSVIQTNSKLKSLCPFIDTNGILRAGGRLQKSQLDEQTKQPIIMPKDDHLTKLIIADAHLKTLHGGPSLMLNYLRSAFWIIGARNLVKQQVRKCVTCAKQKASISYQKMGSLPTVRCLPARPFLNSGVDYAGPINIRTTKGRGHQSHKGYICLFICMSTRAIHLEMVSDMTSQAFLAAFKRFVARRGHCSQMWSDNGTTFVGAAKVLQLNVKRVQQDIAEHLESSGTKWHFIPPHAPNFGGLWEAGVKSTKFHLKRVIGDSTLTYEEMSTLLCQVEACLNSRPLSLIDSSDPSEPLPLTPGHFLVGESLISVPESNYETSNIHRLTRWQFVQRMLQTFWRRWSHEYLSTLMQRYKWALQTPEPSIDAIVLIKEDNLPPSRWLLGRVIEKHPGHDNITRVVTLRTRGGSIKRPTSKLCILPV